MFKLFIINDINVNPNIFINKKKNIKNTSYVINPMFINTNIMGIYYDNNSNIGYGGNKINKMKKTNALLREEKMEFIHFKV